MAGGGDPDPLRQEELTTEAPFKVSVTRLARWRIRREGGEVWVWMSPLGASPWGMIHASTRAARAPHIARCERVDLTGIVLWLPPEFPIREFTIEWMPFAGLLVDWAGRLDVGGGG